MHEPDSNKSTLSQLTRLSHPEQQLQIQGDLELLELYLSVGDRSAIEALILRYAPMVASVCSLTVADRQLAEDAFQATFLILLNQSVAPLDWDTQGGQSTMSIVGSMLVVSAPDMTHHRIEMMLSHISQMNPGNATHAAQFGVQRGTAGNSSAATAPTAGNAGYIGGGLGGQGGGMF
jgi:hypothetical protein